MRRFFATFLAVIALAVAGALPASADTAGWRWPSSRVVVADQTGSYTAPEVRQAVRELNREQRYLRISYVRGACPAGQPCISVTVRPDTSDEWTAIALPHPGLARCNLLVNGYWDGVSKRAIKPEIMRCVGLSTAPEGVRSLMSADDPAPRLTAYDKRDLRTLYRWR